MGGEGGTRFVREREKRSGDRIADGGICRKRLWRWRLRTKRGSEEPRPKHVQTAFFLSPWKGIAGEKLWRGCGVVERPELEGRVEFGPRTAACGLDENRIQSAAQARPGPPHRNPLIAPCIVSPLSIVRVVAQGALARPRRSFMGTTSDGRAGSPKTVTISARRGDTNLEGKTREKPAAEAAPTHYARSD